MEKTNDKFETGLEQPAGMTIDKTDIDFTGQKK